MSPNSNSYPHAATACVRTGWRSGARPGGIRGKSASRGGMFVAGIAVLK